MKVAILYPIPFGDSGWFGGGERYALELAMALSTRVDTILVTVGSRRHTADIGNLRIETFPWITIVHGVRGNPLVFGFLKSLMDVTVIHCHSYGTIVADLAILFGRLFRKRVAITPHGGGGDITLTRVANMAKWTDGLLFVSQFSATAFAGQRPPRHVVYGGVDPERFCPGDGTRSRTVLYVGRILPHKGIEYLIQAIPVGLKLIIAGRPYHVEYYEYLQSLAVDRDVSFVTDATDRQIIDYYQRSLVSVLPSVYETRYGHASAPELLGLTLIEAMACGTPAICSAVGGMPEVVADGVTGFVVPPGDVDALRRRLQLLGDDLDLVERMGKAGRERVIAQFTWSAVAERCLVAYRSMI